MSEKPSRINFHERMEYLLTSIRSQIFNGSLREGEFLPSLNILSDTYELSKNSIQKGLNKLETENLIEKIPRVGIRVLGDNTKKIIRFGYYPSLEKTACLRSLVLQYEKENPYIEVKLIPLQYENFKAVVSHYLTEGMLDVISISDINFNQVTETIGRAENLFEKQERNSEMYSFLNASYEKNESLYAVPFIFSPVILCYHEEHFDNSEAMQLKQPMNWDDFIQLINNTSGKRDNKFPFYFNPTSNNRWPIFLLQSGIKFNDDGIESSIENDDLLRRAIQTSYNLIHDQNLLSTHFASDDTKVESLFLTGKISVIMTTYFGLNDLIESDLPYKVAPLPFVKDSSTLLVSVGLALNKHSAQKEIAKNFIDYLSSYESQSHIKRNTLSIPSSVKAGELKKSGNDSQLNNFEIYESLIPNFRLLKELHLRQEKRIQLLNYFKLYWMGLESEEETFRLIKEIFNKV